MDPLAVQGIKIALGYYGFLGVLALIASRTRRKPDIVPSCRPGIFLREQEITEPTLYIEAKFKRTFPAASWLRKLFVKVVSTIWPLTFLLKYKRRLYVEDWVGLQLHFENLWHVEIEGQPVKFVILYPGGVQIRPWVLNMPNLKEGDACKEYIEDFFKPQVPGTHRLVIQSIPNVKYAGPSGVTGRRYRFHQTSWMEVSHIHSISENRQFAMSWLMLIASVLMLGVALVTLIVVWKSG